MIRRPKSLRFKYSSCFQEICEAVIYIIEKSLQLLTVIPVETDDSLVIHFFCHACKSERALYKYIIFELCKDIKNTFI